MAARVNTLPKGRPSKGAEPALYRIHGLGKHYPALHCKSCGENPPVKSNQAIHEELERLSAYLKPKDEPSCPDADCDNHGAGIKSYPEKYRQYGKTATGSPRFQCRQCNKTFSVTATSTSRQRYPHKNKTVFLLLMNKNPLRRISEVTGLGPETIYNRIDFLHRQCSAFVAHRERRLLKGMPIAHLDLSTDRQNYIVNWTHRKDKRNVQLTAAGTADNITSYVFGMHLNFDAAMEQSAIEREAMDNDDYTLPYPFRRHARLWLKGDYKEAIQSAPSPILGASASLKDEIAKTYAEASRRIEVEKTTRIDNTVKLPGVGMQTHSDYTLYGHFFFLKHLLAGAKSIDFYLDQDSGMRAALMSAFCEDVASERAHAFFVQIEKDLTTDQKKQLVAKGKERLKQARTQYPGLAKGEIRLELIKEEMAKMPALGQWGDRWLFHPFPDMSEPEKAVSHLTDVGKHPIETFAARYDKATLHGIDRFFMQVRRRLSVLERPIASASAARRMWYGYSAYNPEIIEKLLTIFRVYYNYCLAGKDKQTPAMRLGLAGGKTKPEDIIYWNN